MFVHIIKLIPAVIVRSGRGISIAECNCGLFRTCALPYAEAVKAGKSHVGQFNGH